MEPENGKCNISEMAPASDLRFYGDLQFLERYFQAPGILCGLAHLGFEVWTLPNLTSIICITRPALGTSKLSWLAAYMDPKPFLSFFLFLFICEISWSTWPIKLKQLLYCIVCLPICLETLWGAETIIVLYCLLAHLFGNAVGGGVKLPDLWFATNLCRRLQ